MSLSGSGVPDPRHCAQHATVGFRRLGSATPITPASARVKAGPAGRCDSATTEGAWLVLAQR